MNDAALLQNENTALKQQLYEKKVIKNQKQSHCSFRRTD